MKSIPKSHKGKLSSRRGFPLINMRDASKVQGTAEPFAAIDGAPPRDPFMPWCPAPATPPQPPASTHQGWVSRLTRTPSQCPLEGLGTEEGWKGPEMVLLVRHSIQVVLITIKTPSFSWAAHWWKVNGGRETKVKIHQLKNCTTPSMKLVEDVRWEHGGAQQHKSTWDSNGGGHYRETPFWYPWWGCVREM